MKKKVNFEDSIKRLEEIVSNLEEGNLDLDKAIELYEEGIILTKECNKKLAETERKVFILKTGKINTSEADHDGHNHDNQSSDDEEDEHDMINEEDHKHQNNPSKRKKKAPASNYDLFTEVDS